jgi:hypothetical protein
MSNNAESKLQTLCIWRNQEDILGINKKVIAVATKAVPLEDGFITVERFALSGGDFIECESRRP